MEKPFPEGREVSDAKRLKKLEFENAWLKKLLADAMLDNELEEPHQWNVLGLGVKLTTVAVIIDKPRAAFRWRVRRTRRRFCRTSWGAEDGEETHR